MIIAFSIYLLCGAVAGILAGLLGVGGGVIIVPMLLAVFPLQGVPEAFMQQLALGTSLASIMFTSISSTRSHNARGAVHWDIWKLMTPGILAGTFFGGLIATHLPSTFLKIFFVCFLYAVGVQMFFNYRPAAGRELPGKAGTSLVGLGIGLLSSFVGIGGGSLSVPFLAYCNIPMHHAVGTSAALGFPIAAAGTLGYIVGGWGTLNLTDGYLGFVNLWALFGIAAASFLTAPLGAGLSHRLPVSTLKRFFACFILIMATKMLWGLF